MGHHGKGLASMSSKSSTGDSKPSTGSKSSPRLPSGFPRLAWSNLAAQSAEQIGLAATPLVAVLALGAGAGETGFLQTAQTLDAAPSPHGPGRDGARRLVDDPAGARADGVPHRVVARGPRRGGR